MQIATVYLDDLNQNVRENQIRALANELEKDIPTILVGDFNMLRPNVKGASLTVQAKDLAVRSLAPFVPHKELRTAIMGMNQRTGVPLIKSFGFEDADHAKMRPTAPAAFPAFGIDYLFHNNQVSVTHFEPKYSQSASDHLAIGASVHF